MFASFGENNNKMFYHIHIHVFLVLEDYPILCQLIEHEKTRGKIVRQVSTSTPSIPCRRQFKRFLHFHTTLLFETTIKHSNACITIKQTKRIPLFKLTGIFFHFFLVLSFNFIVLLLLAPPLKTKHFAILSTILCCTFCRYRIRKLFQVDDSFIEKIYPTNRIASKFFDQIPTKFFYKAPIKKKSLDKRIIGVRAFHVASIAFPGTLGPPQQFWSCSCWWKLSR